MVKVKICGITNLEDALAAAYAGCDALGFIFYKKSPRYISPQKAAAIIKRLPSGLIKIGVFVDATDKFIERVAKLCGLDMLQFHGSETPVFCARFRGYRIIKAFKLKHGFNPADVLRYKTFAYLFDTYSPLKIGGTGKKFNWKLVRHINNLKRPVFLSGGLSAGNVQKSIKCVGPQWVDASSSLETSPGKKDHKKVKKFIETVKKAER